MSATLITKLSDVKTVSNRCGCSMQTALRIIHKTEDRPCPECGKENSVLEYLDSCGPTYECIYCDWATQ